MLAFLAATWIHAQAALQRASAAASTTGGHPTVPAATSHRPAPDVLIIVGDDFNWDDLTSVDAPNIAALASRGMTFKNGYVFPQCSTTRYSLVFGRYPRRDGIGALVGNAPPDDEHPAPTLGLPTLPSLVRAARGRPYHSAMIGKWHLGTNPAYDGDPGPDIGAMDVGALTPVLHGFDHFLAGVMSNLPGSDGAGTYYDWERVDDGVYSDCHVYAPAGQLDAFTGWWRTHRSRLAVLAPNLPHAPHETPPPEWLPPGYPPPTDARGRFEAMLVAFDAFVGRALAQVDLRHTYVFLLADNGTQPSIAITPCSSYATFEGCTKTTVWQGGIRVPFFVAGPGIAPGSTAEALVSSTDVMATVAELLGVPSPGEDSISFAPVLADPAAHTRRIVFSETFGMFDDRFGDPVFRAEKAAIGERYKLRRLNGAEFLFDLASDPGERVRLSTSDPALASVVEQLRAVLADPLDRSLQSY